MFICLVRIDNETRTSLHNTTAQHPAIIMCWVLTFVADARIHHLLSLLRSTDSSMLSNEMRLRETKQRVNTTNKWNRVEY